MDDPAVPGTDVLGAITQTPDYAGGLNVGIPWSKDVTPARVAGTAATLASRGLMPALDEAGVERPDWTKPLDTLGSEEANAALGVVGGLPRAALPFRRINAAAAEGRAAETAAVAETPAPAGGPSGPGGAGGERGLEAAQRKAAETAGPVQPLKNLPSKPIQFEDGYYIPGPNQVVHQAAADYMRGAKLPYSPPAHHVNVDPARASRIAQAFEDMPHAPDDPKVRASYNALVKETLDQWKAIKKTGLEVEFIPPGAEDPYAASPRMAARDVAENNHLWVFPTDSGFGTGPEAAAAMKGNPMLRPTGEKVGDRTLLANDIFRIVHDYFGHFKDGNGFRASGEENAWRSHSAMYSDLARPAMTSETRGQNSWVNYGPHGETNRTARSDQTVYAPQKIGLLPDWAVNEGRGDPAPQFPQLEQHPGLVSPSYPTAVPKNRVADPDTNYMPASIEHMKLDPDAWRGNTDILRGHPQVTEKEATASADELAGIYRDRVAGNKSWILNHPDLDPWRDRASRWYDGANRHALDRAELTGKAPPSVAGVIARLSPGTDWFQNVAQADHLMNVLTNMGEFRWTPAMRETAQRLFGDKPDLSPILGRIHGTRLSDLSDPVEKALWARTFDQTYRPGQEFHIIAPEGDFVGLKLKKNGEPARMAWQATPNITKAVQILEADGHMPTISRLLGGAHKIREFHNNIIDPNGSLGSYVVDTHDVAAGMLLPVGQKHPYVSQNFGTSLQRDERLAGYLNSKNPATTGASGLYGIHADAGRAAAKKAGLLPRQAQSIVWEGVRGLFPDVYKSSQNYDYASSVWRAFRHGDISIDRVRDEIYRHAGGFRPPDWHK